MSAFDVTPEPTSHHHHHHHQQQQQRENSQSRQSKPQRLALPFECVRLEDREPIDPKRNATRYGSIAKAFTTPFEAAAGLSGSIEEYLFPTPYIRAASPPPSPGPPLASAHLSYPYATEMGARLVTSRAQHPRLSQAQHPPNLFIKYDGWPKLCASQFRDSDIFCLCIPESDPRRASVATSTATRADRLNHFSRDVDPRYLENADLERNSYESTPPTFPPPSPRSPRSPSAPDLLSARSAGFRDLEFRNPGSRDPGFRDPGSRDPSSRDIRNSTVYVPPDARTFYAKSTSRS
ncbi:hypothetical protein DFJ73DRAFT_961554 [Zopfochytrium polystomum]|nr:hypothetical protein DFJ73DRAFT_961554 [Zopfochytrium polystomum]